jgi:hypothetical protein
MSNSTYLHTLPKDIIEYLRGFTGPDQWWQSKYKVNYKSQYFRQRMVKTDINYSRILFTNKNERDSFDSKISKLRDDLRHNIFIYQPPYNRWIPTIPPTLDHDFFLSDQQFYNLPMNIIQTNDGLYQEIRKIDIGSVPFVYNSVTEIFADLIVPLIKYDTIHRKRKRGDCEICQNNCPRDLDRCIDCLEKKSKYYSIILEKEGDEVVNWGW